jgi:exopolysaccharide production protein ExoZ
VVTVHAADVAAAHSGNPYILQRAAIGAAGVDVFFVISGFVMAITACSRPVAVCQFVVDRFSRIVPLYWIATLLLLGVVLTGKGSTPPHIATLLASLALVPVDPQPYLGVGWTLVYEMFFYALLALSLLVRPRHLVALTLTLLLLVAAGAAFRPEGIVLRTYTGPLLLEFLAGVWLGVAWRRGLRLPPLAGMALLAAGIAGLAVASANGTAGETVAFARIVEWGLPALAIVAGTLGLEALPIVRSRLGLLLGAASYAIYLSHPAVLVVVRRAWGRTHVTEPGTILAVCIVASILVGVAFHLLVERRVVAAARSLLRKVAREPAEFGSDDSPSGTRPATV